MNRKLVFAALAALGLVFALMRCVGDAGDADDSLGQTSDELAVGHCFQGLHPHDGGHIDFLDGGWKLIEACLADAGFGPHPHPDGGGFPFPPPSWDGGGFHYDGGGFPFPGGGDGGLKIPDGGFQIVECGANNCDCAAGYHCLNPLQKVCPTKLAWCLPDF